MILEQAESHIQAGIAGSKLIPGATLKSFVVASSRCGSMEELVQLCPTTYRPRIRSELKKLSSNCKKFGDATAALAKLQSFQTRKVIAPFLKGFAAAPKYELTSFSKTLQDQMDKELASSKISANLMLKEIIKIREKEVTELRAATSYATYSVELLAAVDVAWNEVQLLHGDAVTSTEQASTGTTVADTFTKEYNSVKKTAPQLGRRLVEIYWSQSANRTLLWKEKAALKDEAEQKMLVDPLPVTSRNFKKLLDESLKKKKKDRKAGRRNARAAKRKESNPLQPKGARTGSKTRPSTPTGQPAGRGKKRGPPPTPGKGGPRKKR